MAYLIRHFSSDTIPSDPLQIRGRTQIIKNDSLLYVTGVDDTYMPNIWSALLCDEFRKNPEEFIRKSWPDMSFLNVACAKFNSEVSKIKRTLSPEKLFILDHQFQKNQKSGASYVAVKIENNKIKYNMLGDSLLFIYNQNSKKLHAYCSMIDQTGMLDLSQLCHCLYNDLTFIGRPIIGEKSLQDSICLIMSRDLANWFINNYKSIEHQAIDTLLALKNNEEFSKLLRKIQSHQSYHKKMFNKDMAEMIIIQKDTEKSNILSLLHPKNLIRAIKRILKLVVCPAILSLAIYFLYDWYSEKCSGGIQESQKSSVIDAGQQHIITTAAFPQNYIEIYDKEYLLVLREFHIMRDNTDTNKLQYRPYTDMQ